MQNTGHKNPIRKSIAIVTLLSFTFSSAVWSAPAQGVPGLTGLDPKSALEAQFAPLANRLEIPEILGSVRERFVPDVPSAATVIHIQDAHVSAQAQQNIRKILGHLDANYGVCAVFLEGAFDQLRPELLKFFKDEKLNMKAADLFMKESLIGGTELYLLDRLQAGKPSSGYGAEEPGLYVKNLRQFRFVQNHRNISDRFLSELKANILTKGSLVFNKALKDFFREWVFYQESQDEMMRHLDTLDQQAKEILKLDLRQPGAQIAWPQLVRTIRLKDLDGKINAEKAVAEKKALEQWILENGIETGEFSKLLESVEKPEMKSADPRLAAEKFFDAASAKGFSFETYPELSKALGRIVLSSEIQATDLFDEMNRLTQKVFEGLVMKDSEKELLLVYADYLQMKKLFALEMIREEYEAVQARRDPMKPSVLTERLFSVANDKNRSKPAGSLKKEDSLFAKALLFYKAAILREDVMFKRLTEVMTSEKKEASVLVTGGFHSQGMTEMLKKNNIAYVEITPRITDLKESTNYMNVVTLKGNPSLKKSYVNHESFVNVAALPQDDQQYFLTAAGAALSSLNPQAIDLSVPEDSGLTVAVSENVVTVALASAAAEIPLLQLGGGVTVTGGKIPADYVVPTPVKVAPTTAAPSPAGRVEMRATELPMAALREKITQISQAADRFERLPQQLLGRLDRLVEMRRFGERAAEDAQNIVRLYDASAGTIRPDSATAVQQLVEAARVKLLSGSVGQGSFVALVTDLVGKYDGGTVLSDRQRQVLQTYARGEIRAKKKEKKQERGKKRLLFELLEDRRLLSSVTGATANYSMAAYHSHYDIYIGSRMGDASSAQVAPAAASTVALGADAADALVTAMQAGQMAELEAGAIIGLPDDAQPVNGNDHFFYTSEKDPTTGLAAVTFYEVEDSTATPTPWLTAEDGVQYSSFLQPYVSEDGTLAVVVAGAAVSKDTPVHSVSGEQVVSSGIVKTTELWYGNAFLGQIAEPEAKVRDRMPASISGMDVQIAGNQATISFTNSSPVILTLPEAEQAPAVEQPTEMPSAKAGNFLAGGTDNAIAVQFSEVTGTPVGQINYSPDTQTPVFDHVTTNRGSMSVPLADQPAASVYVASIYVNKTTGSYNADGVYLREDATSLGTYVGNINVEYDSADLSKPSSVVIDKDLPGGQLQVIANLDLTQMSQAEAESQFVTTVTNWLGLEAGEQPVVGTPEADSYRPTNDPKFVAQVTLGMSEGGYMQGWSARVKNLDTGEVWVSPGLPSPTRTRLKVLSVDASHGVAFAQVSASDPSGSGAVPQVKVFGAVSETITGEYVSHTFDVNGDLDLTTSQGVTHLDLPAAEGVTVQDVSADGRYTVTAYTDVVNGEEVPFISIQTGSNTPVATRAAEEVTSIEFRGGTPDRTYDVGMLSGQVYTYNIIGEYGTPPEAAVQISEITSAPEDMEGGGGLQVAVNHKMYSTAEPFVYLVYANGEQIAQMTQYLNMSTYNGGRTESIHPLVTYATGIYFVGAYEVERYYTGDFVDRQTIVVHNGVTGEHVKTFYVRPAEYDRYNPTAKVDTLTSVSFVAANLLKVTYQSGDTKVYEVTTGQEIPVLPAAVSVNTVSRSYPAGGVVGTAYYRIQDAQEQTVASFTLDEGSAAAIRTAAMADGTFSAVVDYAASTEVALFLVDPAGQPDVNVDLTGQQPAYLIPGVAALSGPLSVTPEGALSFRGTNADQLSETEFVISQTGMVSTPRPFVVMDPDDELQRAVSFAPLTVTRDHVEIWRAGDPTASVEGGIINVMADQDAGVITPLGDGNTTGRRQDHPYTAGQSWRVVVSSDGPVRAELIGYDSTAAVYQQEKHSVILDVPAGDTAPHSYALNTADFAFGENIQIIGIAYIATQDGQTMQIVAPLVTPAAIESPLRVAESYSGANVTLNAANAEGVTVGSVTMTQDDKWRKVDGITAFATADGNVTWVLDMSVNSSVGAKVAEFVNAKDGFDLTKPSLTLDLAALSRPPQVVNGQLAISGTSQDQTGEWTYGVVGDQVMSESFRAFSVVTAAADQSLPLTNLPVASLNQSVSPLIWTAAPIGDQTLYALVMNNTVLTHATGTDKGAILVLGDDFQRVVPSDLSGLSSAVLRLGSTQASVRVEFISRITENGITREQKDSILVNLAPSAGGVYAVDLPLSGLNIDLTKVIGIAVINASAEEADMIVQFSRDGVKYGKDSLVTSFERIGQNFVVVRTEDGETRLVNMATRRVSEGELDVEANKFIELYTYMGSERSISVIDLNTGTSVGKGVGNYGFADSNYTGETLDINPSGTVVVAASNSRMVYVVPVADRTTPSRSVVLPGFPVSLEFMDDILVLAKLQDGSYAVLNVQTDAVTPLTLPSVESRQTAPDGSYSAALSGGQLFVFDRNGNLDHLEVVSAPQAYLSAIMVTNTGIYASGQQRGNLLIEIFPVTVDGEAVTVGSMADVISDMNSKGMTVSSLGPIRFVYQGDRPMIFATGNDRVERKYDTSTGTVYAAMDLDANGHFTVRDILEVINALNSGMSPQEIAAKYPWMDFGGRGIVTPWNVLFMITQYNLQNAVATGEGEAAANAALTQAAAILAPVAEAEGEVVAPVLAEVQALLASVVEPVVPEGEAGAPIENFRAYANSFTHRIVIDQGNSHPVAELDLPTNPLDGSPRALATGGHSYVILDTADNHVLVWDFTDPNNLLQQDFQGFHVTEVGSTPEGELFVRTTAKINGVLGSNLYHILGGSAVSTQFQAFPTIATSTTGTLTELPYVHIPFKWVPVEFMGDLQTYRIAGANGNDTQVVSATADSFDFTIGTVDQGAMILPGSMTQSPGRLDLAAHPVTIKVTATRQDGGTAPIRLRVSAVAVSEYQVPNVTYPSVAQSEDSGIVELTPGQPAYVTIRAEDFANLQTELAQTMGIAMLGTVENERLRVNVEVGDYAYPKIKSVTLSPVAAGPNYRLSGELDLTGVNPAEVGSFRLTVKDAGPTGTATVAENVPVSSDGTFSVDLTNPAGGYHQFTVLVTDPRFNVTVSQTVYGNQIQAVDGAISPSTTLTSAATNILPATFSALDVYSVFGGNRIEAGQNETGDVALVQLGGGINFATEQAAPANGHLVFSLTQVSGAPVTTVYVGVNRQTSGTTGPGRLLYSLTNLVPGQNIVDIPNVTFGYRSIMVMPFGKMTGIPKFEVGLRPDGFEYVSAGHQSVKDLPGLPAGVNGAAPVGFGTGKGDTPSHQAVVSQNTDRGILVSYDSAVHGEWFGAGYQWMGGADLSGQTELPVGVHLKTKDGVVRPAGTKVTVFTELVDMDGTKAWEVVDIPVNQEQVVAINLADMVKASVAQAAKHGNKAPLDLTRLASVAVTLNTRLSINANNYQISKAQMELNGIFMYDIEQVVTAMSPDEVGFFRINAISPSTSLLTDITRVGGARLATGVTGDAVKVTGYGGIGLKTPRTAEEVRALGQMIFYVDSGDNADRVIQLSSSDAAAPKLRYLVKGIDGAAGPQMVALDVSGYALSDLAFIEGGAYLYNATAVTTIGLRPSGFEIHSPATPYNPYITGLPADAMGNAPKVNILSWQKDGVTTPAAGTLTQTQDGGTATLAVNDSGWWFMGTVYPNPSDWSQVDTVALDLRVKMTSPTETVVIEVGDRNGNKVRQLYTDVLETIMGHTAPANTIVISTDDVAQAAVAQGVPLDLTQIKTAYVVFEQEAGANDMAVSMFIVQPEGPVDPNDVNNDGFVSAIDVLGGINDQNANGARVLPGGVSYVADANGVRLWVDTNRDGKATPADVLGPITRINARGPYSSKIPVNAVATNHPDWFKVLDAQAQVLTLYHRTTGAKYEIVTPSEALVDGAGNRYNLEGSVFVSNDGQYVAFATRRDWIFTALQYRYPMHTDYIRVRRISHPALETSDNYTYQASNVDSDPALIAASFGTAEVQITYKAANTTRTIPLPAAVAGEGEAIAAAPVVAAFAFEPIIVDPADAALMARADAKAIPPAVAKAVDEAVRGMETELPSVPAADALALLPEVGLKPSAASPFDDLEKWLSADMVSLAEPQRNELRTAVDRRMRQDYGVSFEAVGAVYYVAEKTLRIALFANLVKISLGLLDAGRSREQVLNDLRVILEGVVGTDQPRPGTGTASQPIHLVIPVPASVDVDRNNLLPAVLAIQHPDDELIFLTQGPGATADAAKALEEALHARMSGRLSVLTDNIHVLPGGGSYRELAAAAARIIGNNRLSGERGTVSQDGELLDSLDMIRRAYRMLSPDELKDITAQALIAADYLRNAEASPEALARLDLWLQKMGINAASLSAKIKIAMQALQKLASAA